MWERVSLHADAVVFELASRGGSWAAHLRFPTFNAENSRDSSLDVSQLHPATEIVGSVHSEARSWLPRRMSCDRAPTLTTAPLRLSQRRGAKHLKIEAR